MYNERLRILSLRRNLLNLSEVSGAADGVFIVIIMKTNVALGQKYK